VMGDVSAMSYGKIRRLSQCADDEGHFTMLAADQRGNLRRALRPDDPDSVPAADLIEFKTELSRSLSGYASAILLDPEYGAAQAISAGAVSGATGLVVALEATGYEASPHDRASTILAGWSPAKAAALGASAAKLLVYFHPDAPGAGSQVDLVAETAVECEKHDLPLIVEPLSFSLDERPLTSDQKGRVVAESARILGGIPGVDMLKLEFPARADDPEVWEQLCNDANTAAPVPWVLLSAGVDFETFALQAEVACRAGACGVLAGRAVWKESVGMPIDERRVFYDSIGRDRLTALGRLVASHARPWRVPDARPADISATWYR